MDSFSYYGPTCILFGNGKRKLIGIRLKGKYKKVLLVCGKGPFRENGLYDEIKGYMEDEGILVFGMGDIDSNPRLNSVREGARVCKQNNIECVIALGGGSTMDCAKVIAAAAMSEIDPYHFLWGDKAAITSSLDTVMIPTIAATGTEVNNYAVIVNEDTSEKYYCQCFFPTMAIMDPEITATVPLKLALWGAMDILSHTFEFYFNGLNKSEFQNRFSEAIILSTIKAVEDMVDNQNDLNARGELMWCAVMAWGGLTKIGRGDPEMTCHSIEESFSGFFDTHHGACLGVITPRWMEYIYKSAPNAFARFARNIFGVSEADDLEAAAKGIVLYKDWLKKVGAPNTYFDFSNKDFNDKDLEHVAETAFKIYWGKIGKLKNLSIKDIIDILKSGKVKY